MKNFICIISLDFSYINLTVLHKKNKSILFQKTENINLIEKRAEMNFLNKILIENLFSLIQEAETNLNIYIYEGIFILKNENFKSLYLNLEMKLNALEKIKLHHIEKINKDAIEILEIKNNSEKILNILHDKFYINNDSFEYDDVLNKKTNNIKTTISILILKKIFSENFELMLAEYKFKIKHLISASIACSEILKNEFRNQKLLIINIGHKVTDFCIRSNNTILFHDNINIGIFDVINDLSTVLEVSFQAARFLKEQIPILREKPLIEIIENPELNKNPIQIGEILEICDARINEIIIKVFEKLKNQKFKIDEIFIISQDISFFDKNNIERFLNKKINFIENSEKNIEIMGAYTLYKESKKYLLNENFFSKISCFLKNIFNS